jgi:hypothetical protein
LLGGVSQLSGLYVAQKAALLSQDEPALLGEREVGEAFRVLAESAR